MEGNDVTTNGCTSTSESDVDSIVDENLLRSMLETSEDFELRRRIRSRLRELKKSKPDQNEADLSQQQQPLKPHQQNVVRPRETWATSSSAFSSPAGKQQQQRPDETDGIKGRASAPKTTTYAPKSTGKCGSSGGLPSVSLRHTDVVTGRQRSSDDARHEIQALSLRPVSSSSDAKSKPTGGGGVGSGRSPKPEFLEGVTLRKVDAAGVKTSVRETGGVLTSTVKPTARSMDPKAARERFKKIDAAAAATMSSSSLSVTNGDGGLRSNKGRCPSPNPNSIRQAMLDWCRYRTDGYKNVDVVDFSGSWSDGLAFCAIVHSFFPDAFNFDELDPNDARTNLQLAFDTAQQLGGVYPLLEADDIIQAGPNMDWKCVFTYVNSVYAQLSGGGGSAAAGAGALKPADDEKEDGGVSDSAATTAAVSCEADNGSGD